MDSQLWKELFQSSHVEGDSVIGHRNSLLLSHYLSMEKHPNQLTYQLLKDSLVQYSAVVDDPNGVNNFIKPTLELISAPTNNPKEWKFAVKDSDLDIVQRVKVDCDNSDGRGACGASFPTQDELESFFARPKKVEKIEAKLQPSFNLKPKFSQTVPNRSTHLKDSANINNQKPNDCSNSIGGIYSRRIGGRYKKWSSNEDVDNVSTPAASFTFRTAGEQLKIENQKKFGNANRENGPEANRSFQPVTSIKKSLGGKRSVANKFVPPIRGNNGEDKYFSSGETTESNSEEIDERLKNIEPKMIEMIKSEIMDQGTALHWDDIAGLDFAKTTIQVQSASGKKAFEAQFYWEGEGLFESQPYLSPLFTRWAVFETSIVFNSLLLRAPSFRSHEIVVWPMLRPDIFTGLRRPPKGILLFGPPGTGKTLIGKCIASQSKSTFFSISASSLTSKWVGDGEKMVRALFAVARVHQPAVIFIDEIDSLLSQRSDTEHESSRRIKTEFLVQFDGAATGDEDRILIIGATNRPQELDEAARRRLIKRLYIPLPDIKARIDLVGRLMKEENTSLTEDDIEKIAELTDGYSGADMKSLCQEAALGPLRSLNPAMIATVSPSQLRPVSISDFTAALNRVRSSVSASDLDQYVKWDGIYGSGSNF